jgi:predicted permease
MMFRRKRSAEDFAEEIKAHLEMEAEDLRAEGRGAEEARWEATRTFGNVRAAQEQFYLRGRFPWLDRLVRDLRFGFRSLRQSPGFALTAILTVALGVGANTAVFSVMNAVLLRSLPVADPSRVVYLRPSNPPRNAGTISSEETVSYAVYAALHQQVRAMQPLMAYVPLATGKVAVRFGAVPEQAQGEMVSGQFFSGLGVGMAQGHGFREQDETSHAPLAVLSYNYWARRFGRDPGVVGKTLLVNSVPMTIIGVAAKGFEGVESGVSTDFWIPLQNRPELNAYANPPEDGKLYIANPKWWCLRLIGRLAPGISRSQALAQLQPVFQAAAYAGLGNPQQGEKPPVLRLMDAKGFPGYQDQYGKPLQVLMMMVGFVLLIALSNAAMLLMARNAARQREFAVRLALGATRAILLRQLLIESALLVTGGGVLAWVFAVLASRTLGAWAQIETSLAPDGTVLLFTLGLLVLAALVFGLAPMRIALSAAVTPAMKTSQATAHADAGRSRTGRVVVVMQMMLCVVLLVGAGLLIRTLRNLEQTPLGMHADGLVVFGIKPNTQKLADTNAFYRELMARLRALPGVNDVTIMQERLGSGWSSNNSMKVDGRLPEVANSESRTVRSNVVGPDFFHTLGVPVLMGRDFSSSDTSSSPHVGIVNETFVKRFLYGQDPLGHRIGPASLNWDMEIVGVVKDHKYRSIEELPIPMAWYMYAQIPVLSGMNVELRVHGDPLAILPAAARVVAQLDPNLPLLQPMTQRAQFDTTIAQQLLFARLAGIFGLLAVLLVATGLYGVLAYRVNMRTAEIGVRMAVGARRGQVVWMILKDSLSLTVVGALTGIPLAILAGHALSSSLYGVKALDTLSYLTALLTVGVVALAATVIPARRAAGVDPLKALRTE